MSSSKTELGLATVATTGSYTDLTDKPTYLTPLSATMDITGITTLDLDQYADVFFDNPPSETGFFAWFTYTGLTGTFSQGEAITFSGGGSGTVYLVGPTDTLAYLITEGSISADDGETVTGPNGSCTVNKGYPSRFATNEVFTLTSIVGGPFTVGEVFEYPTPALNGFGMILTVVGSQISFIEGDVSVTGLLTGPITGVTSGATATAPLVDSGSYWERFNQYEPANQVQGLSSGATATIVGNTQTSDIHLTNITGTFTFPELILETATGILAMANSSSVQYSNQNKGSINLTDTFSSLWSVPANQETIGSVIGMNNGAFPVTLRATTDMMQVTLSHTNVATAVAGDIVLENDTDVVLTGRTTRGDTIVLNNAEQNGIIAQEGGAIY